MKLVEIKNSLAKLYYEPADFPLLLSDFLTIDDGNQKILAQVVSLETTNKDTTNCAILKFSLDLHADNTHSSYSGYVPPLDALVSKTQPKIISSIFSDQNSGINLGKITSSANINLDVKPQLLENFLYIQSDIQEETQKFSDKILEFNFFQSKKTLVIDFEGITSYENANQIELGKDFKLPVDNDILNYIYENDLTGLTVEQKTIVQDIILEIQEYIDTLEEGYIPFNTLLNVVNDIYETDKSVGVILLRNKLLKYNQFNIFASKEDEIISIDESLENNTLTVLNIKNASSKWQKETLDFVLNYIQTDYYLIFEVKDEAFTKEIANKIYKAENIKPVLFSKYDSEFASQFKSFAKNLILFKPIEQQRAFASYNSFLNKITQGEFIVSGESTYYTPLIIKSIPDELKQVEQTAINEVNIEEENQLSEISSLTEDETAQAVYNELTTQDENDNEPLELSATSEFDIEENITEGYEEHLDELEQLGMVDEDEESNENKLKNIFDESLEKEIAKDVDKMFYAEAALPQDENFEPEELNVQDDTDTIRIDAKTNDEIQDIQEDETDDIINYNDMFSDDDLDMLDEISTTDKLTDDDLDMLDEIDTFNDASDSEEAYAETNLVDDDESQDFSDMTESEDITPVENDSFAGVPIYSTEIDEKIQTNDKIKISEGNMVYHEKYGKGVVEQLISYGKKTLCSIQFDNVGRRLLDPNLADLKQM